MCPQCGAPLEWKRTDVDGWVPCDVVPALCVKGGKLRVVRRRELMDGCCPYNARRHPEEKPVYAWMPHFYTCPVLRRERREWAMANR